MKSPEINNAIKWVDALCEQHYITPPFFCQYPCRQGVAVAIEEAIK